MNLNIFILFDGALMFAGLQILMIWKAKKRNVNFTLQSAKNNIFSQSKCWAS